MANQSLSLTKVRQRETESHLLGFIGVTVSMLFAETLILLQHGEAGLVVHAVIGGVLLVAVQRTSEPASLLYQSLFLIPVLRVFSIGVPVFADDTILFLGVLYVLLLGSTMVIVRSQRLSLVTLGVSRRKARLILHGILLGVVIGGVQYRLTANIAYEPSLQNYVGGVLVTGLLVASVEEVLYRGLIQRWAEVLFGKWLAILLVSVLYAFTQSVWLAPINIVFAGAVALLLGWLYSETNNMLLIVSVHGSINVTSFLMAA